MWFGGLADVSQNTNENYALILNNSHSEVLDPHDLTTCSLSIYQQTLQLFTFAYYVVPTLLLKYSIFITNFRFAMHVNV